MHPSPLRSLSWMLALATLTAVGPAHAELPPAVCEAGWWADDATVPLTVTEAPTVPWVMLPIQWVSGYGSAAEDLTPPTLTVTVTDGDDAVVPGTVTLRPESAAPDVAALRRAPRWRPDAPLTAGASYTMHVVVPEAPGDGAHSGCPYGGVDRTLTVSVAASSAAPVPEVTLFTRDQLGPVMLETCDNLPDGVPCADHPDVCCQRAAPSRVALVSVAFPDPLPSDGRYHAVELTVTAPGGVYITSVSYPAGNAPSVFLFDPFSEAPAPASVCVTAIVYDLFSDAAVATDTACADPADHEPAPAPPELVCDPVACAAGGPGPEPPVEPGPEASAETDPSDDLGNDYVPDVIGGDVFGGDAQTDGGASGSDLVPNGAPEASGCASGGTSPGLVLTLLGLALLALRRRRARS